MAKFDHHVHTSRHSPDSFIDPSELIERAQAAGLDGVVITEHDHLWASDELEELQGQAAGLVVLAGAEISALEGHFLVYGLPDLSEVPPGVSLAELLSVVRRHEAAVVAAHPYRWDQDFDRILAAHGPGFDALELVSNNITPETRRLTQRALERYPELGATGSSDGHAPRVVGCYYTEFNGPIGSMAEFVSALRRREGRPRSSGRWPQSL